MDRKKFMLSLGAVVTSTLAFSSGLLKPLKGAFSNFKYVYSNKLLKNKFLDFLKNVFHLFPENDFHELIDKTSKEKNTDKEIYIATQSKLSQITPYFSTFSYKLPALSKQKEEMAKQTFQLLKPEVKELNGYMEVGSSGRYLDYLEDKIKIAGDVYYADWKKPGYSISEMVDRGQIPVGATYIPMEDYKTNYQKYIKNESLDLVTVYIGFHHCPLHLRTSFISSIRDTLKVGGKLILRDHDCTNEDERTLVALAHDVFNMGTNETWEYNNKEIRNFYTLDFICDFVENVGFKFHKKTLFQKGDPTKNALMLFTKI